MMRNHIAKITTFKYENGGKAYAKYPFSRIIHRKRVFRLFWQVLEKVANLAENRAKMSYLGKF